MSLDQPVVQASVKLRMRVWPRARERQILPFRAALARAWEFQENRLS